ncbi:MAG: GreA/GreB family elongation factor [Verrucomicrobiales bacterium]
MEEEIASLIAEGKLNTQSGDKLKLLAPGAYCTHRSWGFGQVASWNLPLNQVVIDFKAKAGHVMQAQYAVDTLQPLSEDHILVWKATRGDELKDLIKKDIGQIMRMALDAFNGSATQDQVSHLFQDGFLNANELRKFWENARKTLKTDGHFALPAKRTLPWQLRESALSRTEELLESWQKANTRKERFNAVENILKELSAFKEDESQLTQVVASLDDYARRHRRLDLPGSVEAMLLRDEMVGKVQSLNLEGESPELTHLIKEETRKLGLIISELPAARQRRFLVVFTQAFGDEANDRLLELLPDTPARLAAEIGRLLVENGCQEKLDAELNKRISEGSVTSEILLWLCRDRKGSFQSFMNLRILSCIISALEMDQLNEIKKTRLRDFVLEDQDLMDDILDGASLSDVRDVSRKLLLSPALAEIDKRSLIARIIKKFPDVHSLLHESDGAKSRSDSKEMLSTSSVAEVEDSLIVSWQSLNKRKVEYDELVNKLIPENSKEIQVAREYGDLRENFEFKAAKQTQAVLSRRKVELEEDLTRAQGTDFSDADTSQVSIGTEVILEAVESGQAVRYAILGAWDSQPDAGILAYKTEIGKRLLGHKVGEEVSLPGETGESNYRIAAIQAWQGQLAAIE